MQQLDGVPVPAGEVQALAMLGFGHFTTMRVEHGAVRGLAMHLDRLVRDAAELFDVELDPGLIRERVREAIADEPGVVTVRVTLFDPGLRLERPGADAAPKILVTPRPVTTGPPAPLRLRSMAFTRDVPRLKHTGMFGALHRRRLAQREGFDDAVFTDGRGRFAEGPTWNLGFVRGASVVWPDGDALPGVTRGLLADVAGDQSVEPVTAADLPSMEAAFVTSSGVGVRPIGAIDDVAWDPVHPALAALRGAYAAIAADPI